MSNPDESTPLGRALRRARTDAGVRQTDVAGPANTGKVMLQSRLSRVENGQAVPTGDELRQLAARYGIDEEATADLLALAEDAREGITDSRLVVQRGNTLAMQQRWRSLERDADEVRSFQPILVLGSLQTARYAAVAMGKPVDSPEVRERQRRRERLSRTSRHEVLIQTEGSLRQTVGDRAVMLEQIDALADALDAPSIDLGIVRADTPMPFLTACGFHVYDRTAVVVGLQVAAASLTDEGDVAEFRRLFDRLSALAVWGDDARSVLTDLRAWYDTEGA